jgi:uncharacterized protein
MAFLLAAISLGFLGSFHCVGMCGPIALALPVHNKPPVLKHVLIVLYNLGRITTYSLFGLIAGIMGQSIAMAGFQQALSITIGVILLTSVLFTFKNSLSGSGFFLWIKASLSRLFSKGTRPSLFIVGLLNGFLPCGLVYMGIAGAMATGDVAKGVAFMAAFGLGTAPLMFALPVIGSSLTSSSKNKIRKATPVVVTIMALLLILRGLNLGIPYVSPAISSDKHAVNCHESYPDKTKIIHCQKPNSK